MLKYLAAALVVIPFAPALAQIGNPANLSPDTRLEAPGTPAPHQTNNTDRLFAQLAAAGGLAEVELSQLANTRASNTGVKNFARMMIDDHSDANARLKKLAEAAKIPLPEVLDPDHSAVKRKLETADGETFDVAYMRAQIIDHQKTTQLLTWEIGSGQDVQMQRYASMNLPKVMKHLRLAQNIAAELTGQASREISSLTGSK
ncbi:putative membrane protein [Phyllobacterium ifriqiyense]|uniref:Membrane protein n=1 Tax=Phyllobacterium ifriqiyense TaxID=314238 RepID=A0ABU0S3A9_9HYPH|nr:DUF4142 domain-containing protein [Phyllobacterium ifriqiyense]MDQ0995217.1 putative membrane protein [Phyllobacterium ifriqiyense]